MKLTSPVVSLLEQRPQGICCCIAADDPEPARLPNKQRECLPAAVWTHREHPKGSQRVRREAQLQCTLSKSAETFVPRRYRL